jgi:hypothetical protein
VKNEGSLKEYHTKDVQVTILQSWNLTKWLQRNKHTSTSSPPPSDAAWMLFCWYAGCVGTFLFSLSLSPLIGTCLGFIMSLCSVLQPQQASPFHRVPALAERMRCGFLLWYWYYRTLSFQRHDWSNNLATIILASK